MATAIIRAVVASSSTTTTTSPSDSCKETKSSNNNNNNKNEREKRRNRENHFFDCECICHEQQRNNQSHNNKKNNRSNSLSAATTLRKSIEQRQQQQLQQHHHQQHRNNHNCNNWVINNRQSIAAVAPTALPSPPSSSSKRSRRLLNQTLSISCEALHKHTSNTNPASTTTTSSRATFLSACTCNCAFSGSGGCDNGSDNQFFSFDTASDISFDAANCSSSTTYFDCYKKDNNKDKNKGKDNINVKSKGNRNDKRSHNNINNVEVRKLFAGSNNRGITNNSPKNHNNKRKTLEPIEFKDLRNAKTTVAALGYLEAKESPIFGRRITSIKRSLNQTFSLRTKQPFYVTQSLSVGEIVGNAKKTDKGGAQNADIDRTAVEALSMQERGGGGGVGVARSAINGPRTMIATSNNKFGITDINRNNGYNNNKTVMTSANTEKREHLYKILVIGELGTGKTSFIKRYVHQFFSQNYRATIGVDFALKVLHWDANTIVRLQLWDIAGQERFGNMTRVYYKEAVGAFIVFDVTRSGTFDCVSKWKEDLDSKVQLPDGSPIPCILLANKCDQEKQGIVTTPEKMDEYVQENGFAGWFETSAKENINIDEAARALVNKILFNDKLITASDLADSEKFNLNNSGGEQSTSEAKSKCSC